MKTISGSSGRSLLLLITNILLMFLGAITVASGSMAIGIFLLHLFTFASQLFLVVPVLLIMSGTLTIIVAIFGLSLFKRKNEKSGVFLAYASIILVALLISLSASISSFVLREAIAHRFSKTDVTSQLKGYATDPFLRSRWDSIQREFRCCGGYNVGSGYQDWEGVSVEPLPIGANPAALITGSSSDRGFVASLSQVPDSCCIRERIGCGKTAFEDDNSGTISQKIYVNGCMTEARTALFKHVMPLLLICALVSLVVGLIELLLLLCAVCFADHIKRLSSLDGSSTIGRSSSLSQEKQGIIQDTGEAYLSHEEKQLEYGLDNANPGYFNGEELIGNEDDSASWYDSSTNETRIRHQLPLLDGSPSLRKKFFFQGSQASLNNGYELQQNNQDPEAGTGTDSLAKPELEAKKSSEKSTRQTEPQGLFGIFSVLSRLFGREKNPSNRQQKELNLREDALDREATLMNVLKSVNNKSEPDIVEASKETKSSGFFNFGKKSKSKENVLETNKESTEENTEVKKLPTLDDKTIDKNKKYPPMENLTETESKKSGWTRFKELRDTVFKRKHQTLKEEEPKEMTETETKTEGENENKEDENAEGGANGETKDGDIDFEEKKKDSETSESSTEASSSSTESDKSEDKKVERKSSSNSRKGEDSGTKVERKPSNRSVNFEEDELRKPELPAKPQFKSGTPIRGSTFQRSTSEAVIDEPAMRSISPNRPLRVSGFGVTPQTNPRHTRTLSMTTNPKLNTIHEPVRHRDVRVRTRSLQVAGNIPIDGAYDPDDEVAQYNRSLQQYGTVERRRYTTTSPGPYNRSLSPQSYLNQQQPQNRLARMQSLARSEEQLNKAPVMVEYLRPVGILTGNQSPPPRPGSAQAHRSRDNSQESVGHVTRINIEEKEDLHRERSDSRTRRKSCRDKEDSRSRERSDSRKKSSKSKDHDKKKKKKKRSRSRSRKRSRSKSASSGSSSGSSGSESGSDSESESDSGSDSDSKDRKRKSKRDRKSRKSDDRDRKSSRKESKSKHRKKSRRHRDDSSPEKKHRSKSSKSADKSDKRDRDRDRDRKSSSKRNEEVVTATMETSTSPTREQQRTVQQSYDTQDYMQRLPYENQSYVVDDPRNYYSTATLPSNASLRKPSGILVPLQQPHTHTRAPSEPRVLSKKMSSNTLDRYTLMAANAQRSKSADRLPMKYRRVSLDPGYHQGYPQGQPQKLRSVSMATHEAGDLHVLANPAQTYRTTVEMEPHSGEIYTVQQGPGGVRMAKSSRVRVSQQEEMMGHRRPTHVSEARLMVQGDGSEQITLPHGMMPPTF